MIRPILLAGIISTLITACSFKAQNLSPTAHPKSTATPTSVPRVTSTATQVEMNLVIKDDTINCRFGPGIEYVLINELHKGQSVRAVGRNDASTWVSIQDPGNPNGFCWVSTDVIETNETLIGLPITLPPFVTVTDLTLRAEPNRILVNCRQFPQTVFLEAEITTNGPTLLTWKWEASTGMISDIGTLIFQEAGTQVINEYYQIGGPNEYWVKLYILTPNKLATEVHVPVSCTT